jgi:hypothetical protein
MDPVSGNRIFNYNTTTALFNYYGNYDNNFFTSFQFTTTTTLLTVKATLQIRFVIPNGTSPGVDFVFPFTNGGYADLTDITILSTQLITLLLILTSTLMVRLEQTDLKYK